MNTPAFDLAAREKLHEEALVLAAELQDRVQQEITPQSAIEMARLASRITSTALAMH